MLAIGISLMTAPKLVLLDEPSGGLSPSLVGRLFSVIREIKEKLGVGVLLVEQNVEDATKIRRLNICPSARQNRFQWRPARMVRSFLS